MHSFTYAKMLYLFYAYLAAFKGYYLGIKF